MCERTLCCDVLLETMASCRNCDIKKRTAVLRAYLRGGEIVRLSHALLRPRKREKQCITHTKYFSEAMIFISPLSSRNRICCLQPTSHGHFY